MVMPLLLGAMSRKAIEKSSSNIIFEGIDLFIIPQKTQGFSSIDLILKDINLSLFIYFSLNRILNEAI